MSTALYVLADKNPGKLYLHFDGRRNIVNGIGLKRTHAIKNRVFIDDIPEVVNKNYMVIGKLIRCWQDQQDAIVAIVERISKNGDW